MPKEIVNPNRVDRISYGIVGLAICAIGIFYTCTDGAFISAAAFLMLMGILTAVLGFAGRPYAVLSREGIQVKYLFQKRLIRWENILQVGIYCSGATKVGWEYGFPIVVVCPGGSLRKVGKDRSFLRRNWFRSVLLPNKKEILKLIVTYYGPLDFDDIHDPR